MQQTLLMAVRLKSCQRKLDNMIVGIGRNSFFFYLQLVPLKYRGTYLKSDNHT